jgi:orotate phosphoribosyltransferase
MMTDKQKALALQLFEVGAVKFDGFKLKLHEKNPDAPRSPIYVDLRIVRSFPDVMDSVVEMYMELMQGLYFDVLADVPTAATPIVAVLSHKLRVPMISPRKEEKKHGIKRPIDGQFKAGQIALLIDDLITLAESKLEAIEVLEENGIVVRDVLVLLDREQGGVNGLEQEGYKCHLAFKLKELMKFYLDSGKISRAKYDETITYLEGSQT